MGLLRFTLMSLCYQFILDWHDIFFHCQSTWWHGNIFRSVSILWGESTGFCAFLQNRNLWIWNEILSKFGPYGLVNDKPAVVQVMIWPRIGDKPLTEPILIFGSVKNSNGRFYSCIFLLDFSQYTLQISELLNNSNQIKIFHSGKFTIISWYDCEFTRMKYIYLNRLEPICHLLVPRLERQTHYMQILYSYHNT